jgi:hypothetical protein
MSSAVLTLPRSGYSVYRPTLRDELFRRDVCILPDEDVESHMRAVRRGSRPGLWRVFGPPLELVVRLATLRERFEFVFGWLLILSIFGAVDGILACAASFAVSPIHWLLYGTGYDASDLRDQGGLVGFGSLAVLLLLVGPAAVEALGFGRFGVRPWRLAASYWRKVSVDAWYGTIPSHLLDRVSAAKKLGAEVRIVYFDTDPFIEARRGSFFRRERCYIGAWNTGTWLDAR